MCVVTPSGAGGEREQGESFKKMTTHLSTKARSHPFRGRGWALAMRIIQKNDNIFLTPGRLSKIPAGCKNNIFGILILKSPNFIVPNEN